MWFPYIKSLLLVKNLHGFLKTSSKMVSTDQCMTTKDVGKKTVIILNRPKSLNALNRDLLSQLSMALAKYEKEKTLIILKGGGGKAFSAGGDLLQVKEMFEEEEWKKNYEQIYKLQVTINLIATCKVPVISFMDGITFGGGAGIAYFSTYNIATEKTLFAMPESKIAFHPNAGGTYLLNRAVGKLGYYLGLTGASLKGADVVHAGLATHFCLNKNLDKLEEAILNSIKQDNIKDVIDGICEKDIPKFTLEPVRETIDRCFSEATVVDIFIKLKEDGSDWAKKTLKMLESYSPSSLKVILKQLQRGVNFDLQECLIMESYLTVNFYKFTDVLEGTRIALIDKGDKPKWNPSRLEDVTEEHVEKYFEPFKGDKTREIIHNSRGYIRKSKMSSTERCVVTKEFGDKCIIILNRPNSLNALNGALMTQFSKAIIKYEREKSLIILKGAGGRAFSAGGDLLEAKEFLEEGDWTKIGEQVTRLQVNLNLVATCKVPVISIMNGIAFGGGAGIGYLSTYSIATEKTLFAMPESKIDFHPNAGGTYLLNRALGKLGYYLALTGNTLRGADVVHAGLATHFCLSKNLDKLEEAILNSTKQDNIKDVLDNICEKDIPKFTWDPVMDIIDKCFSEPTVEDIFKKLREDGSVWAEKTLKRLESYSPTSLKVILKQLHRGRNYDIQDCLVMESNVSVNFYKFTDVLEGTRITLVDRGDVPKWNPSKLEDVKEQHVEKHFASFFNEDKIRQTLNNSRNYFRSKY